MNRLKIFVSSTCYDLSQVRLDMSASIIGLGHEPILSESNGFPVNPSLNPGDNCIEVVEKHADVFVLIVGNRYGQKMENGKSITNMEFITAQQKGIPIYVFVNKEILNILSVYKMNKSLDFSGIVDTSEIFEFVIELKHNSKLWVFPFEKAQDIQSVLDIQLSSLFKEALKVRTKLFELPDYNFYTKISKTALKILVEKEDSFEFLFLAQSMVDALNKHKTIKRDFDHQIYIVNNKTIDSDKDFLSWYGDRFSKVRLYIESLSDIFKNILPFYLKEPGTPADLEGLNYVANTYARISKEFALWALETLSADVEEDQEKLKLLICDLTKDTIERIWDFPNQIKIALQEGVNRIKAGEAKVAVKLDLTIEQDPKLVSILQNEMKEYGNRALDRKRATFQKN